MSKMKVGLIGCGNIGADLCIALQRGEIEAEICALTDIDESHAERLKRSFLLDAAICPLEENVAMSDFVVECAAADAVRDVVETAIRHGKDCLVISIGGLMDHQDLFEKARSNRRRIWLPSGALCGLDGVRAAAEAGLHLVQLTTRKPPKGLEGAPYLVENGIDLNNLSAAMVVFEGSAREACHAFPKNVNVAAALSFAGVGPEQTRVRVIADPAATANSHEIIAEGAFGRLVAMTENLPSPRNIKSSYLASLSAVAELRVAAESFRARN